MQCHRRKEHRSPERPAEGVPDPAVGVVTRLSEMMPKVIQNLSGILPGDREFLHESGIVPKRKNPSC